VHEIRRWLEGVGLESFAKTSGGKGFHVCIPIAPEHTWDEVLAFSRHVAEQMVEREPKRYVATASKAARRGKIYLDYLRNGRGATFVAPYSTRAKAGAPVSMPLHWDQVSPDLRPEAFTLRSVSERIATSGTDPFERMLTLSQHIDSALIPKHT
jgi:bifunctional non-homologous end joining protein LigD